MSNFKFIALMVFLLSGFYSENAMSSVTKQQIERFEQRFVQSDEWGIPYPADVLNEQWHVEQAAPLSTLHTRTELASMTQENKLTLQGSKSTLIASFGNRVDRVITKATLNLDFIYSPTLIARQSQLKVYLNSRLVGVIGVDEKNAGTVAHQAIELPIVKLSDFNQLTFELIGYYQDACYDPSHSGLWFEMMPSSHLVLEQKVLSLKNDLSLLPAPFFDRQDQTRQEFAFVFPPSPEIKMVNSASKLASWFGLQSKWRGTDFSLHFDQLPTQHAVVVATNTNRPFFLKDYPEVSKPTVVMVSHPLDSKLKMMLVLGKDEAQLDIAMQGIIMGHNSLSGQVAIIKDVEYAKKIQPYDAPLWINNKRPMRFSEFVDNDEQLQQSGVYLRPIQFNMHIPSDLFVWETGGVPIDLSYRYTPSSSPEQSRMSVLLNGQLVESLPLNSEDGLVDGDSRIRMPFSREGFTGSSEVLLPSFKLGIQNTMKFDFLLKEKKAGCNSEAVVQRVAVDGDSTIDFSGFEHYAEMPDLQSFAFSGLPFTKMADLSETIIIMPDDFGKHEISLLFSLLAKMSSITGFPAINPQLLVASEPQELADHDILLINAFAPMPATNKDNGVFNLLIEKNHRSMSLAADLFNNNSAGNTVFALQNDDDVLVSVKNQSFGDLAAIIEYESPVSDGRSVLSMMSNRPESLAIIESAIQDPAKNYQIAGSSVLLHHNKIVSSNVGEKYYTGHLPVWNFTRYHLSQRPFLLLSLVLLAVFILAIIVWRLLKHTAYMRTHDTK